jgi:hypothetical protein
MTVLIRCGGVYLKPLVFREQIHFLTFAQHTGHSNGSFRCTWTLISLVDDRFYFNLSSLLVWLSCVILWLAMDDGLAYAENVGDCGTEGRKGGGKERKKRRKRAEKSGTCYFDASSFFLRNTQNIGISDYI